MSEEGLKKKIDELEKKLAKLNRVLTDESKEKLPVKDRVYKVQGHQSVGDKPDMTEIVREVVKAKQNSEHRAGLVKNTDSGSTHEEDNSEPKRIPSESIHHFDNLEECLCTCHPNKKDCMYCYDHPEHLEGKRKKIDKPEYDEAKIMKLIEQDKAKKEKKSWKNKLFGN